MGEFFQIFVHFFGTAVYIENAKEIAENGVDWIVAGTAVFGGDIKENIRKLKGEF